ncbi:MAG: SGNH/GDSL hydrolase family protein [Clostridia bacterium]|nr:SGNH/GDSL hydrolase family protein [Clostridia bacterium]
MNNYFKKYVSNTLAGSSNQSYFMSDNTEQLGRVFYKAYAGGKYEYSFMFSNVIDSTFADGSYCKVNKVCANWTINSASVMVVKGDTADLSCCDYVSNTQLTFNKKTQKDIISGEIFFSDSVTIECEKNDYLCLEISFTGTEIPYFEEIIVPTFRLIGGKWVETKQTPLACMVGCMRQVEKKIGFLGDSITEGIGVEMNSYAHWNAKIAEAVGEKYSYWNLGIGFARASDAASNGSWLNKAKQMDAVTICLGVNDLGSGYSATEIKCNLETIVRILQDNKIRTILFTVPPFDYDEKTKEKWQSINSFILNDLSKITEVYDVVAIWGDKAPKKEHAIYGGHPNEEGCLKLSLDFIEKIKL